MVTYLHDAFRSFLLAPEHILFLFKLLPGMVLMLLDLGVFGLRHISCQELP
jgi:hypothetical protein